ncbi:MAG: DUF1819 family protein [Aggregatilineales bacterium]
MDDNTYSMGFTTCSIRIRESIRIAEVYVELRDWNATRSYIINNNLLQQRTTSSSKKIYRELASRLKLLTEIEMLYLVNCTEEEKLTLLWIAVCRRYGFIREFVLETLHESNLLLDYHIKQSDFEVFFNSKLVSHEELNNISSATKNKVRQILFRMLSEVGLIHADNRIVRQSLSPALFDLLKSTDQNSLYLLPLYDAPNFIQR